jgi:hypothetical protein
MTNHPTLPARSRLVALAFAALSTLAILAGVDSLAQPEAAGPQMALVTTASKA